MTDILFKVLVTLWQRRSLRQGLACCVLLLFVGQLAAQEKASAVDNDLFAKRGPIQDLAEPLSEKISVVWERGRLKFQLPESYEAASEIVTTIRQTISGGGGSSRGGTGYSYSVDGNELKFEIAKQKVGTSFESRMTLDEIKTGRVVQVRAIEGKLNVTIRDSQAGYIMRVLQLPSGRITVQELYGDQMFSGNAADFDSFVRTYPEFATSRLLPIFKHFSIGQILTPYDDSVRQQVADLLAPMSSQKLDQLRQLTAGLHSDSYKEREAAQKALNSKIKDSQADLVRLATDPIFKPEVRSRVRDSLKQAAKPELFAQVSFLQEVIQKIDTQYLLDLIQYQEDDEKRQHLIARLTEMAAEDDLVLEDVDLTSLIVGQEVSGFVCDQLGEWEQVANNELKDIGTFQELHEEFGALVQLKIEDGQFVLDREHWSKPFGGKPIKEISAEIQKLVKENNLPDGWYQPAGQGFAANATDYPHVLFEKLEEKVKSNSNNRHHHHGRYHYQENHSPNRQFQLANMAARMVFDPDQSSWHRHDDGNFDFSKQQLLLNVYELEKSKRVFELFDNPKDREFRLLLTSEYDEKTASMFVIQIHCKPGEVLVQDARTSRLFAAKASSFAELQRQYPQYFQESLLPLLEHFGISLNPNVKALADAPEAKQSDTSPTEPVQKEGKD